MKTPDFTLEEVKEYLHSETHYIEAVGNFKNAILDHIEQLEVKAKLVEQYRWERDTAIDQLKQLGVGFGEKVNGKIPRWISVEERLPEGEGWVLAIGLLLKRRSKGNYGWCVPHVAEYRHGRWCDSDGMMPDLEDRSLKITHWMPIPQPPEEDE